MAEQEIKLLGIDPETVQVRQARGDYWGGLCLVARGRKDSALYTPYMLASKLLVHNFLYGGLGGSLLREDPFSFSGDIGIVEGGHTRDEVEGVLNKHVTLMGQEAEEGEFVIGVAARLFGLSINFKHTDLMIWRRVGPKVGFRLLPAPI